MKKPAKPVGGKAKEEQMRAIRGGWVLVGLLALALLLQPWGLGRAGAQGGFSCAAVTDVSVAECNALVALYNSANGPAWANHANWLTTNTVATWYGVTASGGHVLGLTLTNNQLSGSLPALLGDLYYLQTLNLSNNQLSGSLPPQLANLANLRTLKLSFNQLTGSVPATLGLLAQLQTLYLTQNQLSGSLPPELGNLTQLQEMLINANQISGSVPPQFGNLTHLWNLTLDYNQLTGSIPLELTTLPNLGVFNLSNNQLSGSLPPQLGNLTGLSYLYLHGNQFSGSIPPELGNLPYLYDLFLSNNQLGGALPTQLGNLANLRRVTLNANPNLVGSLPLSLTGLSQLVYFQAGGSALCEPTDPAFQSWKAGVAEWGTNGECYTIQGTILSNLGGPMNGVTITDSGGLHAATSVGGRSTLADLPPGTYTFTPALPGHIFSPVNRTVEVGPITGNGIYQDFVATPIYTISGSVLHEGVGLPGVTISYSGPQSGFVMTGSDGGYVIPNLPSNSYTLSASLAEYTFSGPQILSLSSDRWVSFSAFRVLYSLGGSVTLYGVGQNGVTVGYSGPQSGSVMTGPDGSYSIAGLPNGSYTLTPSLPEYTYNPPSSVLTLGPSQSEANFSASRITYTISGTIRPELMLEGLMGVTVSYSGPQSGAVQTNYFGNYAISGLINGSYTLTPNHPDYLFSPNSSQVTVGPSRSGANFTPLSNSFSIAGQVTLADGTTPLPGVNLAYSGPRNGWTLSGPDGTYSIAGLPSGSYILTPSLPEYAFSAPQQFSLGPSRAGLNFTAARLTYTLTGRVALAGGGVGLQGVALGFTGPQSGTVYTLADGSYTLPGLINGEYTLTPVLTGYTFSPPASLHTLGPSQSGANFSATPVFTVSGKITNFKGGAVPGVKVQALQNGQVVRQAASGPTGDYSLAGLLQGNYTIRPVSPGKVRLSATDPRASLGVTLGPGQSGLNFQVEFQTSLPVLWREFDPTLFYQDPFNSDLGWQLAVPAGGAAQVQGGQYVMQNATLNQFMVSLSPFAPAALPDSGYSLKVTATRVSGDPSFGVVFDWISSSDFYLFQFDSDLQIYTITHQGAVIALNVFSPVIQKGGQPNTLEVKRKPAAIGFYMNGALLIEPAAAPIGPATRGKMGLQLSTYSLPAEVRFDNLLLRRVP